MKNTVDPSSGQEIRNTDNSLRECDARAPQDKKPLSKEAISDILKMLGGKDGDR